MLGCLQCDLVQWSNATKDCCGAVRGHKWYWDAIGEGQFLQKKELLHAYYLSYAYIHFSFLFSFGQRITILEVLQVSSPLLILHGAADKVTDPLVSQFLYEKASSKDKTLKLYEEGYHCILEGEPDDRIFTVLRDIIAWLDSHCSLN